jgi:hypothetical protein
MARDILNDLSDWALGPMFVGTSIVIALTGWLLVSRFLSAWRDPESSQTIVGVVAMVMTLFALVLAFVIVNLFNGYETAAGNVSSEASSLSALLRDARAFPAGERGQIDRAVADYVAEVRDREFSTLRSGREDPEARRRLTELFASLQRYSPVTETQKTFYASAADRLNTIADERQKRIEAAETSIPGPLLALMIVAAALTLATTLLVKTHRTETDLALLVSVAVIVGLGLFTALILEYPFSGSIAVNSGAFEHIAAGV